MLLPVSQSTFQSFHRTYRLTYSTLVYLDILSHLYLDTLVFHISTTSNRNYQTTTSIAYIYNTSKMAITKKNKSISFICSDEPDIDFVPSNTITSTSISFICSDEPEIDVLKSDSITITIQEEEDSESSSDDKSSSTTTACTVEVIIAPKKTQLKPTVPDLQPKPKSGDELRALAQKSAESQQACITKSVVAFKEHNAVEQKKFSDEAEKHRMASEKFNEEASAAHFRDLNKANKLTEIDLHQQKKAEAQKLFQERVQLLQSKGVEKKLKVITGYGRHSAGGAAVLKPLIQQLCHTMGLPCEEATGNPGVLIVGLIAYAPPMPIYYHAAAPSRLYNSVAHNQQAREMQKYNQLPVYQSSFSSLTFQLPQVNLVAVQPMFMWNPYQWTHGRPLGT